MRETVRILVEHRDEFLSGLAVTLKMTLCIWVIGIAAGSFLGIISAKYKKVIGLPIRILTFGLGGIPVLVFLYWLHYPFQTMLGIQVDGFFTTIFTLSIINTVLVAEQIRTAIEHFPNEYVLSGEVSGFSPMQITMKIQAPFIIRQILPALLMIQVVMMHSTLFGSLISVDEIFRIASRVNSQEYKPVEVYSSLALLFLLLSLPITGLSYWIKKKYSFIK